MRRLLPVLFLTATTAHALDVCPIYGSVHEKEIIPRIRSGIPFKLLSIAADANEAYRRIVRIEFDLWNETVAIEVIGKSRETSTLKDAPSKICHALSLPELLKGHRYKYRLMLNPVLGEGLQQLKEKTDGRSGLLEIKWDRLAKDLETEKTLIESELM